MKVPSLGWEDLLGEGMAIHSRILNMEKPMHTGTWWATAQSDTTEVAQHAYLKYLEQAYLQRQNRDCWFPENENAGRNRE